MKHILADGQARALPWMLVALLISLVTGCGNVQMPPMPSPTPEMSTQPLPTPTPFPIGTGQPAPVRQSVAMLRIGEDGPVAGAALVITSDGYLLTSTSVWQPGLVVTLPDGSTARPIRVAGDETSGLTLVKVPGHRLVPVRLSTEVIDEELGVFAAGYDAAIGQFGEISGSVTGVTDSASSEFEASPPSVVTDIPVVTGFEGGALSDLSGALVGMSVASQHEDGSQTLAAIPHRYLIDWLDTWRAETNEYMGDYDDWPVFQTPTGLSLRYPTGWAPVATNGDAESFLAELVPSDPDVPLRMTLSVQPRTFDGSPTSFAEQEFGGQRRAWIWGDATYAGLPGVRLLAEQEGTRVDVVYLFSDDQLIALRLTTGYAIDDVGEQARRGTSLFEAVLQSMSLEPPS